MSVKGKGRYHFEFKAARDGRHVIKRGNDISTHLSRHEGERIEATEEYADTDRDPHHQPGQGEDGNEQRDQPEVGPSWSGWREGELEQTNKEKERI